MKVSVSEIKAFLTDQQEWQYAYILKRSPKRIETALEVGSFWHVLMENFYKKSRSKPAALTAAQEWLVERLDIPMDSNDLEKYEKIQTECAKLMQLFSLHWSDPCPESETIAVEQPIEHIVQGYALIGKPDRIIRYQDKFWHMQHRTLSDRTNIPLYLEAAQRDLHELVYAYLCVNHYNLTYDRWGGTLFNIVRKLSQKRIDESPESAFVQAFIPIDKRQIFDAIAEVRQVFTDMEGIRAGIRTPIANRDMEKGRFGNVLSPYFKVKTGELKLDNDTFFSNTIDRYADNEADD